MSKRIFSFLLAIVMVLGLIPPMSANALTYEIADEVIVNNVTLGDGYYVLEGSTEYKKGTPPADADYAYFKDHVLYLKNFNITTYRENRVSAEKLVKCGIGMFQYAELYWDGSYMGSMINDFPLTIHLTGTNRITDSLADYSIYACYKASVTFTGDGTLEMNRPMEVSAGTTVKGGTLRMIESGAADKVPMIKTASFKMEGGELNMRATYRSGIECTDFSMSSGKLDMTVLGNSQYTGSGLLTSGGVSFSGGTAKIQSDGDAVQCSSLSIQAGVKNVKFISTAASEQDGNYMAVDASFVTLPTNLKTVVSDNADGSGVTALPNNYTGNLAGNDYVEVMKCWTINGKISGVESNTKTTVELYKSGSSTPMATTTVTGNGNFTFENVEAGSYTVKATAEGYITASKNFMITTGTAAVHPSLEMKPEVKFTTQPEGGTVVYNQRHIANWATNFDPVKLELVTYGSTGKVVQIQELSAGAFQASLSYLLDGLYYRIRAYYDYYSDAYVESDKFYVTPDRYFTPNPQHGNTEGDIIDGITYVPNGDGTFNANVHVDLSYVDGQMLQQAWIGTGYYWYDHNNSLHSVSVDVDTSRYYFTLYNVGKNLIPGKEWRVKVYLAEDPFADWEWQGYYFSYVTDTVPELKPEDVPTPVFTTQPQGGDVAPGQKLMVSWATNFTPVKVRIMQGSGVKPTMHVSYLSDATATSTQLEASDYGYFILAFYNDTDYVVSNKFYVTEKEAESTIPVPAKPYKIANVVSGVHVYWKATEGAVKYGLWRSETGENGTYEWVANPTVPHFTDTKVESGKTYHYKVTAMNAAGVHSEKSAAIGIIYLSTPDITSRFNKAAGITLGWNKITGATGYAIYRKSYSGTDAWVRVGTVSGNSTFTWQDTSVKNENGKVYKYTVRALGGADMKTLSGCRNAGRTMARLTSRTLNSAAKASATSIKCSWTTSSAVTGYEVRFMIGDTVYKTFTVGNYKTGVKTFTGLKAGQTYKIQVRSYLKVDGMGFYSAWSEAKNVKI